MRPAALSNNSTVAAILAKDLASLGARRCFGLLGTANFKISHGLVEAGVELISARHEGNAASMADAYAKASGELANGGYQVVTFGLDREDDGDGVDGPGAAATA